MWIEDDKKSHCSRIYSLLLRHLIYDSQFLIGHAGERKDTEDLNTTISKLDLMDLDIL